MIKWDISLDLLCYEDPPEEVTAEWITSKTVFKLDRVGENFFSDQEVEDYMDSVESQLESLHLDTVYYKCISQLEKEMKTKLPYFVSLNKSNSSEKRKLKPFYTDYLGELWRLSMVLMQNWRKCLGCHKDDIKDRKKKF